MALEMREKWEKCGKALPHESPDAYICSYECTWCGSCTKAMHHTCPNCGGELVKRPQRRKKA